MLSIWCQENITEGWVGWVGVYRVGISLANESATGLKLDSVALVSDVAHEPFVLIHGWSIRNM